MSFEARRRSQGILVFGAALLVALLHLAAFELSLYWSIHWFDTAMHVLGGFVIGSMVGWLISFEVPIGVRVKIPRLFVMVSIVLVVALLWEVFEYVTGFLVRDLTLLDTSIDVLAGVVGGIIAYVVFRK